jgi:hypothetical protein
LTLPFLVAAVDDLYRSAVMDAEMWSDAALADWIDSVAADRRPTPDEAKELRRALAAARKLVRFWSSDAVAAHSGETDWAARVDIALGRAAWRPTLQLALSALETDPTPELFAHVSARFRLVTGEQFHGGIGYDDWLAR